MIYQQEREEIAYFMRRLYRQFLTTTSGGNISCRTAGGDIAVTASQSDKCELTAEQVGVVTLQGELLTPGLKLSIETGMHLAVYRSRPDVCAIVHAHPVTASFFCAAEQELNTHLTAEAYAVIGDVVRIPYALMGSAELAAAVADALAAADCGLMENHGVIALGKDLLSAFDRMELLENAAKQTLMSALFPARSLSPQQLGELDRFAGRKPQGAETLDV